MMSCQDQKIKVLDITTVSGIGGTESMLLSLIAHADREKFEFIVVSLFGNGPLGGRVRSLGVRYYNLKLIEFWLFPRRLCQLIQRENIDIVQTYGITADVVVRPHAKVFGAKVLISSIRSVGGPKKWYRSILSKFASSQVDLWISNSEAGKRSAIAKNEAPQDKIVVVHNGMDANAYRRIPKTELKSLREKLGIHPNNFVVLTVANLRPMKRHEDILGAIPLLKQKGVENVRFCFVGTDRSNGRIRGLAQKLGVLDKVVFAGFHKDLAPFYSLADLFLLPSEWEGLPGSIMEAMAFGLPIIATNVGGIPELIRDRKEGVLIPAKSPPAIAKTVAELYDNANERQRLGANAVKRLAENFRLEAMVEGLQNIYDKALEKKIKPNKPKPTRILRVIARLNIGGPAIQAVRLSAELNSGVFRTMLVVGVVGEDEGDMAYLAKKWGVKPVVIQELGREIHWWDDLIALKKLIKIIREYKPDIVHTHTAKAGTIGRVAAIITRVHLRLHTFHGHVFAGYFTPIVTRIFIRIERFLAHFTHRIIAISHSQKKDFTDKFHIAPQHQCIVVPLGLDLENLLQLSSDGLKSHGEFGLGHGDLVVTIVGRMAPIKNHELFFNCASVVAQKCGDHVRFLVVGDGELRSALEQQVKRLGLSSRTRFVGWQSEMAKVYQVSDIVVLTSLNEGTPVSIIEAMAAAKPVVATNVGGVSDIVSDGVTGFVVPSNNVQAITDKILILLASEKLRRTFGQNARKAVASRFTTKRLVRDVAFLYHDLKFRNW